MKTIVTPIRNKSFKILGMQRPLFDQNVTTKKIYNPPEETMISNFDPNLVSQKTIDLQRL